MTELTHDELIEQRKKREELLNERNLEVLNKVKDIVFLGEDEVATINQVAEYYEVEKQAVNRNYLRHQDEFKEDGVWVAKGDKLKEIKGHVQDVHNLQDTYNTIKYVGKLTVFPRRAVLRVGMLLRDSEVAKEIRDYLLESEELNTEKDTEWLISRKAGKMIRKQFVSKIWESGEQQRMYGDGIKHLTNLAYKIALDGNASELYDKYGNPNNLRDALSEEELNKVRDIENTIFGLLNIGMEYKEIKDKLYNDLIENQEDGEKNESRDKLLTPEDGFPYYYEKVYKHRTMTVGKAQRELGMTVNEFYNRKRKFEKENELKEKSLV